MTAAAAVGEIAGIAGLIGNIRNGIGNNVIGKSTLKALLLDYQSQLQQDQASIQHGLQLRSCQSCAVNLYEKTVVLGEWLASEHIRLHD
jgi:ABC-type sugar transport system ATPase subunit